jgi:hypothetical protein
MSNLDKVVNKFNGITDWNNALKSVWESDNARPWDTYSKDQFRRFWDVHVPEPRSR